jgi:hypothetical protein
MAQQSYRANLSASIYPMALSRAGRSVIVPQTDQNYDRRVDPTGEQKTPGIPQAIYMENVLPTVEGYQSVGYDSIPAFPASAPEVNRLEIRDFNHGLISLFLVAGATSAYVFANGAWRNAVRAGPGAGNTFIPGFKASTASIRGKTYVWQGIHLYQLLSDTFMGVPTFELVWVDDTSGSGGAVTPVGTLRGTISIASSFGYLLCLKRDVLTNSETSVIWSSLLDERDFTPSLATGAGGGALDTVEGTGQSMLGTSSGFRVYADNLVEATYTGNPRYPFRFSARDVDSRPIAVYGQRDSDIHFYISSSRSIQVVSRDGIQPIAPELSEFLERFLSVRDVFTESTNTFSQASDPFDTNKELSIVSLGNKYILVSVGDTPAGYYDPIVYNECFIYDTHLSRYGKLNIAHTHVFEGYSSATEFNVPIFVHTVTGATQALVMDGSSGYITHSSVLLLGRFQGVRSRRVILEEVELESAFGSKEACSLHILPSEDGKTFLPAVVPYEKAMSSKEVKQYFTHVDTRNLCLLIKGGFDLSTVQMNFHLGGHS